MLRMSALPKALSSSYRISASRCAPALSVQMKRSTLCSSACSTQSAPLAPPSADQVRAVIFDMGGVLLPSPFAAIKQLEDTKGLPPKSINRSIALSGENGAFARLERGELCIDDPEFNEAFAKDYQEFSGSDQRLDGFEFMEAITGSMAGGIIPLALDALQCLKAEGVRTAVLTNNFKTRRGDSGMPLDLELFDEVVESCKEGVRKPDSQIYQLALSRLDLSPAEVVFVDDIGRNCKAAAQLGIFSIKAPTVRVNPAFQQLESIVGFPLTGYVNGTKAARGKHELPKEALTAYLRKFMKIARTLPLNIRKYSHGQSNPTYFVGAGAKKFVLRKKPPGKLLPSAHAVEREYQVTHALHKFGVPVPKPILLCEDSSVVGTPFYMMEYVDGRLLKQPHLPKNTPAERTAIYRSMCEALAKLHNVVPADAGLSSYGKEGNYIGRQVKRWTSQYRASETHTIDAMDQLIVWLGENIPTDDVPSRIVHGDFRLDNMILHHDSPKVQAILDWELSTLGDPFSDLAYNCMPYHVDADIPMLGGLSGSDFTALGIPSEEDYIRWYCQFRSLPHDTIPNWNAYLAFSFFRIAAIVQGVYKRALSGQGSSDNGKMAGVLVEYMARRGMEVRNTGSTAPDSKL